MNKTDGNNSKEKLLEKENRRTRMKSCTPIIQTRKSNQSIVRNVLYKCFSRAIPNSPLSWPEKIISPSGSIKRNVGILVIS